MKIHKGDTVLVVQPDKHGASWLWTVMPVLEPIEPWLAKGDGRTRLDAFAAALVDAVIVSMRRQLGFAPTLRSFGLQHGSVRYRGPITTGDTEGRAASRLLYGVAAELAIGAHSGEMFASAVERELLRRLEPSELISLASAPAPSAAHDPRVAVELLLEAVARLASRGPEAA